jgi:membrane protease YdiL (CAAX protease family)
MTNAAANPPASQSWTLGETISWVVILLAVLVILVRHGISPTTPKPGAPPEKPSVQILLAGRYLVGTDHVLPMVATHAKSPTATWMHTLDRHAVTGPDELAAAIVAGEFEGKAAALVRLDTLEKARPKMHADAVVVRALYNAEPLPPNWPAFHAQYGWFADLAASFGKPATDPTRAAVLSASFQTFVTLLIAGCLILMAGAIGFVLLIIAIVLYFQRKLRPAFGVQRPLPSDRRVYVEAFAIYLGGGILCGVILRYALDITGLWSTAALIPGVIAAILWPRLRGQSWSQWRATVGLHTGKGFFHECAAGAVGYLAGLPIFGIGFIITAILTALAGANPSHPIDREISTDRATLLALFLLASVWAPITEELMFRGTLLGHLRGRLGWWASAIPVSLIFAAIHPQGWTTIPALASLALVLAGIREWRGSILGSMTAHALHNTLVLVTLALTIG